jgi:hypothetical protein
MPDVERFHGPGECPVPTRGSSLDQTNRITRALLGDTIQAQDAPHLLLLESELRDRDLELDNGKVDHDRLCDHCSVAEARIAALEAARSRALALCTAWDEAYTDRAEGTGVWMAADESLTQRLRAEWAEINGGWSSAAEMDGV